MELRDFIVTPLYLIVFVTAAYIIRPLVTDSVTQRYFIPALSIKMFGALALGFVYQFYYYGGDTFNFHTHGSRHVWEAFMDSPGVGLKLLVANGNHQEGSYEYSRLIPFFSDPPAFFIVQIATIFDLLTFSTYSATALFFATASFVGSWMFFLTFYRRYPHLHLPIAIASFFIPSVCFWGSGILKDTVMIGCLGALTFLIDQIFIKKKISILKLILFLICLWIIFSVKIFILQAFIPSAIIWIYLQNLKMIPSVAVRALVFPLIFLLSMASVYYSTTQIGTGDKRYAVENIAHTAMITAYDIRFQTGRDAGSGYTLGKLDGTLGSILRLAPQAINVSLFRPYLWEVSNLFMLLSALESLVLLAISVALIGMKRLKVFSAVKNPDISFAMIFSLIFAFAVGISSFNFGTLVRYKIPLMPFFVLALTLIYYEKSDSTVTELDDTE